MIFSQLFAMLEPTALDATARALAYPEDHYRPGLAAFELAVERFLRETGRPQSSTRPSPENSPGGPPRERERQDKLVAVRLKTARVPSRLASRSHSSMKNGRGSPRPVSRLHVADAMPADGWNSAHTAAAPAIAMGPGAHEPLSLTVPLLYGEMRI